MLDLNQCRAQSVLTFLTDLVFVNSKRKTNMILQQRTAKISLLFLLSGSATVVQGETWNNDESIVDSAAWERELVEAWTTIGDCSPSTGMCDHCGFGAAVVDLTSGQAETRFYTAGPDGRDAPFGSYETWEIASITKPFSSPPSPP